MTHFLAIASIFKNENPYLLEWIEFHRLVGVDHFFLYDNDGGPETEVLLRSYIEEGIVTRHRWTQYDGSRHDRPTGFGRRDKNHLAFGHAARNHAKQCDWLMKIDLDEFLLPMAGNHLRPLIARYDRNRVRGLCVPRFNFGDGGHVKKPAGLVTESYLTREAESSDHKDLANSKFLSHNNFTNSAHSWGYRWFKRGRLLKESEIEDLRVYHYYTKSLEESRDRQNMMRTRPKSEQEFFAQNRMLNAVEDKAMLRFSDELRRRVAKRSAAVSE